MQLFPYVPSAPQVVRPAAAAGVAVVVAAEVIGGSGEDNHQAELGNTNTFAALGEVTHGLAGADTNDIADEAVEDARGIGGEEVKDGETVEGGGHDEGVVIAEGKFATSVAVAVVGQGPAVCGDEVGDADNSVDMEAIGLDVVVLEDVLVAGVGFADPIDKHGDMDSGEDSHSLKTVMEVERQQVLDVTELLLPVPAFATSMI